MADKFSFVTPHAGKINLGWFEKDMLPVGLWKGENFEIEVTPEYLAALVGNTNRVLEKGIDVPFQDGHTSSALAGEGFLRDTWVGFNEDGDLTMMGLAEITGVKASEKVGEGSITNVSVGILGDFVDGEGEHFGPALDHVALTPFPVVHKQSPFQPAAELVSLDRSKLPKTVKRGDHEMVVLSRDGAGGVSKATVSNAPWNSIDKTVLPESAFLYCDMSKDRRKSLLAVYEGGGPLAPKDGRLAHQTRGSLNRHAVHSAVVELSHMDLSDEDRVKVARRLLALYSRIEETAPASLLSMAGQEVEDTFDRFDFEVTVGGMNGPVTVSSVKELVEIREDEENRRTAWWALSDWYEAVNFSDMTPDEKKKELKAGFTDFIAMLDLAKRSITIEMRRPDGGPETLEVGMNELLKNALFLALLGRLGIEVPDEPEEGFVETVLSRADVEVTGLLAKLAAAPTPEPEPEPEPTLAELAKGNPHVAELAKKVVVLEEKGRKDLLSKATSEKDAALAVGKLTADGADAFEALLAIQGGTQRIVLDKAGKTSAEVVNVSELVTKLVSSLPDGAALDMEERTKRLGNLEVAKPPVKGERTAEDIEQTAVEQVEFARSGTAVTGGS